jgi:hypothetical protein
MNPETMMFVSKGFKPCVSTALVHSCESVGSSSTTTKGMLQQQEIIFMTAYTLAASIFLEGSALRDLVTELPNFPLRQNDDEAK